MSNFKKTIIVCGSIFIIVELVLLLSHNAEGGFNIAIASLLLSAACLIIGGFLCFSKKTNDIGKAMLICAGVMFLIGFSICSVSLTGLK
jgi:hypothetical protein